MAFLLPFPFGTTTLYHDPDTDFHVLAHCFTNGSKSPPHDHGPSWAVYGQVTGYTDMTVWNRTDGYLLFSDMRPEGEGIVTWRHGQGLGAVEVWLEAERFPRIGIVRPHAPVAECPTRTDVITPWDHMVVCPLPSRKPTDEAHGPQRS